MNRSDILYIYTLSYSNFHQNMLDLTRDVEVVYETSKREKIFFSEISISSNKIKNILDIHDYHKSVKFQVVHEYYFGTEYKNRSLIFITFLIK